MAAEATFELLRMCRSEIGIFAAARPRRYADWLRFYEDHRGVRRGFLGAMGVAADAVECCESLLDALSWASRADKPLVLAETQGISDDEWREQFSRSAMACKSIWDIHWEDLNGEYDDDESEADWQAFIAAPEVQFCFCVVFPCWILHGKWPGKMLRGASQGGPAGLRALTALVRIDNQVIHHPRVYDVLHPPDRKLRASRRSRLARALVGKIPAVSRIKVKYRLGRLIYDVAQRMGAPLTTPAINELFAIAARIEPPNGRMPAGEIQPGSFLKGIERSKGHWDLGAQPDKDSLKAVRALREALF